MGLKCYNTTNNLHKFFFIKKNLFFKKRINIPGSYFNFNNYVMKSYTYGKFLEQASYSNKIMFLRKRKTNLFSNKINYFNKKYFKKRYKILKNQLNNKRVYLNFFIKYLYYYLSTLNITNFLLNINIFFIKFYVTTRTKSLINNLVLPVKPYVYLNSVVDRSSTPLVDSFYSMLLVRNNRKNFRVRKRKTKRNIKILFRGSTKHLIIKSPQILCRNSNKLFYGHNPKKLYKFFNIRRFSHNKLTCNSIFIFKKKITNVAVKTVNYTNYNKPLNKFNIIYTKIPLNNVTMPSKNLLNTKLNLCSKINKPFVFNNTGLFVTSKFNWFSLILIDQSYKYRFKKQFFSFLYPNHIKKAILIKKNKIIINRFFMKQKLKNLLYSNFFSFKNFLLNTRLYFNYLYKNKLDDTLLFSKHQSYTNKHSDIIKTDVLYNKGADESFKHNEVFIPRIRFKPGYQRLWRLARSALKESLKLNYRYQYRLTRYLMRFSRRINNYFMNFTEISTEKTIMYSKILPDVNSLDFFLQKKLIYLNGYLLAHKYGSTYVNDILQIIVSK